MSLSAAMRTELLKVRRSRVPRVVALGFALVPLMGALFMLILKDPERARSWGIIGTKAQLTAGVADWPTYLGLLAQATAVGGLLVFSFVVTWVFGREFADRTAKELLATRTPRWAIVSAKGMCAAAVVLLLIALVPAVGLPLGLALELPAGSPLTVAQGVGRMMLSGLLTLALMPVIALLASVGRGYLLPLGCAILLVFLAQIAAATGWGAWFPWSVPALYSGAAGPAADQLAWYSPVLVVVAGVGGTIATYVVWLYADQAR